jgi:ubiquilin
MTLNVHVKLSAGGRHTLAVDVDMTVEALKARIAAEPAVDIPAAQQRLIYKGRVLQDTKTLAEYGERALGACTALSARPLTRLAPRHRRGGGPHDTPRAQVRLRGSHGRRARCVLRVACCAVC